MAGEVQDVPKVNRRKRSFALAYVESRSATKAAVKVGYAERSAYNAGYRLMKDPKVAALIRHLEAESLRGMEADSRFVMAGLRREALGEVPDTSSHARVRALHLIGMANGMFRDEQTDTTTNLVNTSVNLTVNNVTVVASDLDLAAALAAGRPLPQLQAHGQPADLPPAESLSRGEGG